MTITANAPEILRTLQAIIEPDQVTELRAVDAVTPAWRNPHTVSGYFDSAHLDAMAKAAAAVQAPAVYFIPNPVAPALLARAANRLRDCRDKDATTSDADIVHRRWLKIDADPIRPAGISSTDAEHAAAIAKAAEIAEWLSLAGWPAALRADSGNGAHLMYRVDLPRDDGGLLKRILAALAFRFDDDTVCIDQTTFNPARIWKLYGTVARKGDDTPQRPHRLSALLHLPETLTPVPRSLLDAVAAMLPAEPERKTAASGGTFDIERWIGEHFPDAKGPQSWQGGRKWILQPCPWNAEHHNRSAFIVQFASGAIAAGCHHNGCAGRDWHALRDLKEPGWRDRTESAPARTVAAGKRSTSSPASSTPPPATTPEPADPHTLADFAPWVNSNLERRSDRATKRRVADHLRDWMIARERLLYDMDGNRPYLLTDDGYAIPLADDQALDLHCALRAAGLNPTEPAFSWLLAELRPAARTDGRPVRLARWSMSIGDRVYLSCGPTRYVLAERGELHLKNNGDDGILFASDACLPEWDPTAQPVDPLDLAAFKPALATPPEVKDYTPALQQRLLAVGLCALVANVRPLPIIAILGDKGGGKTTLSRAILRLFLGRDANVTPLTADERDFWTVVTATMVACFDNADAKGDLPWLPDALAVVATGGRRQTRTLYTDASLTERPITASVLVNSRTATFARPDVAERILPLLTTEMDDGARCADSDLDLAVRDGRSGMLVHLAQTASTVLTWLPEAPEHLPARFLDFARVVWAYCKATEAEAEALPTLQAWRAAQALAVGEADPLLMAIIEKAPALMFNDVTPTDFIKALTAAGADIPWLGGGKAIARRLREIRRSLDLAGWSLTEHQDGERTKFTLLRKK